MSSLRLYLRYAAISMRGQLQYRLSFVLETGGHLLITGIEFIGIWALFDRFGGLRGWTLPEVALLYAMADMTFAIASGLARGFDRMDTLIKMGEFDRILLRPRSTVLQVMGREVHLRRLGRLAQGVAVFVWVGMTGRVAWTVPKMALLGAAIVGGVCLFIGIVVLQATTAFWTTETLEVWNAFTYGGNYAVQYPMSIYRPWFRGFFTFVIPLVSVTYLPGLVLLDKPDPLGTPVLLQWLSPLAGVLFLLVALQIWKLGVRRYTSTGS